ncbi:Delta(8)-fatty-acid desaturase 2 [Diplonema papillatum]|nr:Delta(8)-fatty-acid desaturase 2 [Diplonema papillatum]
MVAEWTCTTREGLERPMTCRWGPEKNFTMEEVRRYGKGQGECWVVIGGKVFNASAFKAHPGGFEIIEQCAGKDVTDVFSVNHSPETVLPILEKYYLGDVMDAKEQNDVMRDFHAMDSLFQRSGLYETKLSFYVKLGVWLASLFAVVLLPFTVLEQTWATVTLSAVFLGLFWQQTAFVGHDCGHNSVFHDRERLDYYLSLAVILGFGVSGQWWKRTHNVHHVVTNSLNGDPDIQYLPLFMVDSQMMRSLYSLYHKTRFVYDRAARALVSKQHILYIPVMLLARFNLYAQSWIFTLTNRDVRNRKTEAVALLLYAWWVAELACRVEDPWMAVAWVFLSHAVCGILHLQITISHFSMECFETHEATIHRTDDDDFVRHQLATSLDVDCHPMMDWFHGGLQFQTVHHLWPRVPRHNLRFIRDKYFDPLCKKHGLEYQHDGFFQCLWKTLKHLKVQADNAARTPPGSAMIVQALNLEG